MAGILAQGRQKRFEQWLEYLLKADRKGLSNGWDTCPKLGETCWAMAGILVKAACIDELIDWSRLS